MTHWALKFISTLTKIKLHIQNYCLLPYLLPNNPGNLGIACGHLYYFLEDVFPNHPGGFRVLETPSFLKWLLDSPPLPRADLNERTGGYN